MAGIVIGPLMVLDRVLQDDERATLDAEAVWAFDLLEIEAPPVPTTATFAATDLDAEWVKA